MSTAVGDQQIQEPQRGQAISRLPPLGFRHAGDVCKALADPGHSDVEHQPVVSEMETSRQESLLPGMKSHLVGHVDEIGGEVARQ